MTASVADLRAAIKAKIVAVASMGTVHDYERYLKDQSKLASLYVNTAQSGSRVYGWNIRRVKTIELLADTGRNFVDILWRIRGYMSIEDAEETEKKFDTQIELMRDAFRADPSLGSLCETTFKEANGNQAGLQLEESEPVLFCGVLCHAARLSLVTRVYTNT
jgi:hypothetical protein